MCSSDLSLELDLVGSDERTLLPVSVSASLARGPSDQVLYVRMAVFDNRERRQRELELALARDQALVASQAKSQFLSIMSHEIRTPLNWVMGMLQVLAYRKDLTASAKKQVETAYEGTELLLAVLNDILDFSSLSAGKFTLHPTPGRIFEAMVAIKSLVGQLPAKPAVTMFVSIDPRLNALVEFDATRLRQVLLNLLNNAIKFTDEGSIKLSALTAHFEPSAPEATYASLRERVLDVLRTARDVGAFVNIDAEFARYDVGQGGFAETGRAVQQHVIHRLRALFGRFNGDAQLLLGLFLPQHLLERSRAQRRIKLPVFAVGSGINRAIYHGNSMRR